MVSVVVWIGVMFGMVCTSLAATTPNTLPLPKYIKACKVGKDFDACAVKSGQTALGMVAKGDGRYKLPVMDPMSISKITVTDGGTRSASLNITLKNVKIVGLGASKFISSKLDYSKKKVDWGFYADRCSILCDYEINGRFLVLPIVGSGPGNFTLTKVNFLYQVEWKNEKRNNIEHVVVTKVKLTYNPAHLYISLKNLFNGDKSLDSAMNNLLNENWKEFNNAIGPSVAEGIALSFKSAIDAITRVVPEKLIFPQ